MSFADKIVWITGASSGIGEALALEFADRGAHLILSARRANELERVRNSCARPDDHLILPLDVTKAPTHADALRSALDRFGRIDILVNNSGIGQRSNAVQTSLEVERRIMEVNYFGVLSLTKTVLPTMLDNGSGTIVVVTSVMGKVSTPGHATYAASKHALHGYFEGLRAELHGTGIGITLICPGYIRTNISRHSLRSDGSEYGIMDKAHRDAMPAETCARKIIRAVQRGKPESYVGGIEVGAIYLNRWMPRLFRRLLPRVFPKMR